MYLRKQFLELSRTIYKFSQQQKDNHKAGVNQQNFLFLSSPIIFNKFECLLHGGKCNYYKIIYLISKNYVLLKFGRIRSWSQYYAIKEISSKKYLKLFDVSLSSFKIRLLYMALKVKAVV